MIIPALLILLYVNFVRYIELAYLTTVVTLKDYFKYTGTIAYNVIMLLIFAICWLIFHKWN